MLTRTWYQSMNVLSDGEIDKLVTEPKKAPSGLSPLGRATERNRYLRREFDVDCASGSSFMVLTRQSLLNPFDFSAILAYKVPGFNTVFRLRRYNGKHHHTNTIERVHIHDFHIHYATERYQRLGGMKEDSFAVPTSRYQTLETAVECLLQDCGFVPPMDDSPLFTGSIP